MKIINCISLIALLSLSAVFTTNAADEDGKFAVKGAGKRFCSEFIVAADAKTNDYYLYGGWLEGYLSSFNRFQEDNYDITPWQSTELMLALLQRHCTANPDIHFMTAINALVKTLFPIRLKDTSQLVKINVSNAESYHYEEILTRAKERLKAMGFLETEVDSNFDEADILAFTKFQESIGIRATGIPDQPTLMALFLKPNTK